MKIRVDIPHHPYDIEIEKGCLSQAGNSSLPLKATMIFFLFLSIK